LKSQHFTSYDNFVDYPEGAIDKDYLQIIHIMRLAMKQYLETAVSGAEFTSIEYRAR
jgi:hypothetical protein